MSNRSSVVSASRIIARQMRGIVENLMPLVDDKCAKKLGRTYQGLELNCKAVERYEIEHDVQMQLIAFKRLCSKANRIMRLLGNSSSY